MDLGKKELLVGMPSSPIFFGKNMYVYSLKKTEVVSVGKRVPV